MNAAANDTLDAELSGPTSEWPAAAEGAVEDREARLIFALAGGAELDTLVPQLDACDWARLLHIAILENAVIALGRLVRRGGPHRVPAAVERQIAYIALQAQFRMRRLEKRLEEAVLALEAAGIQVALLKGAALAHSLYGSFTARPMNDVDLLVDADRAREAREIMFANGWMADPTLPGDDLYVGHHHLPPLVDVAGSGLRLELHRALLPRDNPFDFSLDDLLRRTRVVTVGRATARALSLTEHAVYCTVHFAWSHELRLGAWHAFRDLGTMLQRGALDWTLFVDTANAWRARTCSYWTLRLARALSGLQVPDDVLRKLEPRLPEAILQRLERHFTQGVLRNPEACPSVRLERELWNVAMQPRRNGHGDLRPWTASPDLMRERRLLDLSPPRTGPRERVGHMLRWSRYLAGMLS